MLIGLNDLFSDSDKSPDNWILSSIPSKSQEQKKRKNLGKTIAKNDKFSTKQKNLMKFSSHFP
jgi:hypothetical protein